MLTAETTRFTALEGRLAGHVATPGSPDWDQARQSFNLAVDQRPAAVAFPAGNRDVVELVRFAREHGFRLAPQRTGHNAAPMAGEQDETIIVNTSAMRDVEIDAEARRARVAAGAQWQDIVPKASAQGLAMLHGSAPDIGIAGYSLGGGIGWYARKHGLQTNSLTAIELVTDDGREIRADAANHPDLFWALRGGGGNFGIVTALEFRLYEISQVYAGWLYFPLDRAAEVMHAWREWTQTVPDEVTSVTKVIQFPPLEEIPEIVRGQAFAVVEAAILTGEDEGAELMAPLRELGPAMDTFAMVEPEAISHLHQDPPDPIPYLGGGHQMLAELPAEAVNQIAELVVPTLGEDLLFYEVRHLGGALRRPAEDHGALDTVEGEYMTYGAGLVMAPESVPAIEAKLALLDGALEPYAAEHGYFNFVEEKTDPSAFYGEQTLRRLQSVRAKYDRHRLFQANHEIAPTE